MKIGTPGGTAQPRPLSRLHNVSTTREQSRENERSYEHERNPDNLLPMKDL